jgi:hypothetical protein
MGYENGKIYKLVSPNTDKVYIGSTIRSLKERFKEHLRAMDTSARELGLPLAIVLIEDYSCLTRKELEKRETYWIRNSPNTINKNMPRRSTKEYRAENIDKIKRKSKEKYENNKEEISQKRRESRNQETRDYEKKQYYKNQEKRKKQSREQYHRNIEKSRESLRKSHHKHKEKRKKEKYDKYHYEKTWGGDPRYNNNLLKISLDLFD